MAKCCTLINAKQYFYFYSLKLSCNSLQISFLSIKLKREEAPELRTAEEQTTHVVEFYILRRKSLIAQTFHE